MLKFLIQDPCIPPLCNCQLPQNIYPEIAEDCVHFPVCSCDGYMSMKRCCFQNQRANSCLSPLSVYVKDSDSLLCPSVAVGYFNTAVNKGIAVPCNVHRCSPQQFPQSKIHSARGALCTHLSSTGQKINKASRGRSPSPPPLSPVDKNEFLEESVEGSLALDNRLEINTDHPPSLLPAERSCSVYEHKDKISFAEASGSLDENFIHAKQENSLINSDKLEKVENAASFQNLMDRINEKLKSIETTDISTLAKLSKSDGKTETDIKLRSFVTSLLNNAKANDYNIMELLNQHDKEVENKIIQTRFRKKQETFLAMHNPPNSSLFRRQSLQIKRELASLDETFIRKKSSSEKISKKPTKNGKLSPNKTDNQSTLKDLAFQNHENKGTLFSHIKSKSWSTCQEDSVELPLNDFESNPCFMALSQNSSSASQTNLARMHGNCGVEFCMDQIPVKGDERMLDRTKHCIPPVWYSVYVNNFLFQKSSKARNPSDCMEKERKRIQAKTCSNEDTNKMVKNTNLHVVVERLEDTINMAQKTNKSLLKGYKISSKLKEIHDANHDSKNGLIGISEIENKGQYVLSQSHGLCDNNSKKGYVSIKENEASDEGCESLKPSTFDSAALTPNNEDLQTRSDGGDSSSVLNYTSPIKLMFLSEINSSEGIKYTLTSVNDSAKLNIDLYSVQDKTNVLLDKQLEERDLDKKIAFEEGGCGDKTEVNSVFPAIIANETNIDEHKPNEEPVEQNGSGASFKRKPGRPKKIGPQVVKQVKRPIGRPPKPKVDVAENANCPSDSISSGRSASSVADVVEEESINKNITVTVVFGRSRRTKRCVSEGSLNVVGLVPGPPSDCDTVRESRVKQMLETRNSLPKNTDMPNSAAENKPSASGYEYIRLLGSSPVLQSHCSNIVRPNQKPLNVIRKPGRPAKVKISGISVTVNQISSQERKVSISSCLPPLEQTTVLEKGASSREDDEQCNKRDDAQCVQSDGSEVCSNQKMATASEKPELPLRQSVRERRPSLPFLHSVASSSPLPCRSAFLHKSYKLHLKNAKDKKRRHHHSASSLSAKENLENANKRAENHFFRAVNETSLDPLVSSRPSLRWWDPSISNDSLLKELNNRYEQITNTWLHVNGDDFEKCLYDKDIHIEQDCSIDVSNPLDSCILELENSPIRMLFQKECDINELCAWFMQTTETQSLSLVRKANARNPFEVISTRQFKIGTRQSDCSNSPFRKHFKKFALSTPSKSAGKLQILHKIVRSKVLKKKHNFTLAKYKRTKFENLQLDRWRQVKKLRKHGTHDWKSKNLRFFCQSQRFANAGRNMNNKICLFQGNGLEETQSPTVLVESHKLTSLTGTDVGDTIFQQNTQLSDFSTQSAHCNRKAQSSGEFGEDAWRDTTFKDCRIFLKKINPIEEQHSFGKNTAFCTAESVDLSPSDTSFQDKKHSSLWSRSAPQFVPAKCEKHSEGSQRTDTPSLAKRLCIERDTKKSSKRVTFVDGPTEDPKKMNKKRRTQCKPADLNSRKKNKRRLCSPGQVSSCYSKYQLGPLKPVGLPLLGGFPSRAVEYSMIPFQLPLHGSSQVWRPNP